MVPEVALKAQIRFVFTILAFNSELLQALIWHYLSPSKHLEFKIQAQENIKVRLFEEMTNASVPSEKKPPLVSNGFHLMRGGVKFKKLRIVPLKCFLFQNCLSCSRVSCNFVPLNLCHKIFNFMNYKVIL